MNIQCFSRSPAPQLESPLIKLPAEIRISILRLLLWDPNPLTVSTQPNSPKPSWSTFWPRQCGKPIQSFQFSPSVLSCCQQLFTEGSRILYMDNELAIECWFSGPFPSLECKILGDTYKISHLDTIQMRDKRDYADRFGSTPDLLLTHMKTYRILIKGSPEYHRDRGFLKHESCEILCRYIKKYVWDKILFIDFQDILNEEVTAIQFLTEQDPLPSWNAEALSCIKLLRCKKAVFSGLEPSLAAQLQTIVESSTPVLDVLHQYHEVCNLFYEHLPDAQAFTHNNSAMLDELQSAVCDCDEGRFVLLKDSLIERAEQYYDTWEQQEIKKLQEKRNEFNDCKKAVLASSFTADLDNFQVHSTIPN